MDYVYIIIVPVLIVIIWNRRPMLTIILATIIAYVSAVAPELIDIFQRLVESGIGTPKSVANDVSENIVKAATRLPLVFPILAGVGWITKRKSR